MKPTLLCSFLLLAACRSTVPPAAAPALPQPAAPLQPPSVLSALVRLLETADALAPADCALQVRALESDALVDRAQSAEYVRVFLHVTVFAHDAARARAGVDELERSLRDESNSVGRTEELSAERVTRVFSAGMWRAPKREDWVSYSAALRLEVAPGRTPGTSVTRVEPASTATESAQRYVDDIAHELGLPVRAIAAHAQPPRTHVNELRCLLRPSEPDGGHTCVAIGALLRELEARSPAARLTHLRLERSSELPDVMRDDAWTFEAELTLRAPSP